MKANFSLSLYDKDGDKFDDGVFLYLRKDDNTPIPIILKLADIQELEGFISNLTKIVKEIKENYE